MHHYLSRHKRRSQWLTCIKKSQSSWNSYTLFTLLLSLLIEQCCPRLFGQLLELYWSLDSGSKLNCSSLIVEICLNYSKFAAFPLKKLGEDPKGAIHKFIYTFYTVAFAFNWKVLSPLVWATTWALLKFRLRLQTELQQPDSKYLHELFRICCIPFKKACSRYL